MDPRERCYFTPILWEPQPDLEDGEEHEWVLVRERFAAAREGDFGALDDLLDIYVETIRDPAVQIFATNLLGDAGTDAQLERVEAFIDDDVSRPNTVCDLCHSLGLWGRLSAVRAILVAYDRWWPGQLVEGIPAYFVTMLEPAYGPAAEYPREETDEAFFAYEARLGAVYQDRLEALGGPHVYAMHGEVFGVRRLAERFLELLDRERYSMMMRPFMRQRFEASTGIDCSDFYRNSDSCALTIAARLEAWLEGPDAPRFVPGERYFFGHRIPRSP